MPPAPSAPGGASCGRPPCPRHASYLDEINAERLLAQARASAQAAELLAYCQRLAGVAAAEPDPRLRSSMLEWLAWARERATVDLLNRPGELQLVVPAEISPADLTGTCRQA